MGMNPSLMGICESPLATGGPDARAALTTKTRARVPMRILGVWLSQTCGRYVVPHVGTGIQEAAVFVQMADGGRSPRAMCTTGHFTNDELVVRLDRDDDAKQIVLVKGGRYELPLLEARAGRHWELTLAAPGG